MTEVDDFKLWLQKYLLNLDKDFDTDVYTDYIYEILTNFTLIPSNQHDIIDSLHLTIESLLPDIEICKSEEIFNQYLNNVVNKENLNVEDKFERTDILYEIIKKDKNAIDINKKLRPIDPRCALDYKGGDFCESEDPYSDGDIDEQFCQMRLEGSNKIDDVLSTFNIDVGQKTYNAVNEKSLALSITKEYLLKKNNSESDDSDESFNPISEEYGRSNHEAVDREAQELRIKMKEKHQQKKEKDKLDRAKQKDLVKARKENEKKRTQKSERRR